MQVPQTKDEHTYIHICEFNPVLQPDVLSRLAEFVIVLNNTKRCKDVSTLGSSRLEIDRVPFWCFRNFWHIFSIANFMLKVFLLQDGAIFRLNDCSSKKIRSRIKKCIIIVINIKDKWRI